MEQRQWRPGPTPTPTPAPIQPNACPICLTPHFPFCPHPPPSSSSYYHHQPPPFPVDHHSFHPPHAPPPPFPPLAPNWPPYYDHHYDNLTPDGDRNFKRPRIDDSPLSFSEDERRLKLIRDHGVALATHQQRPQPEEPLPPPPPPPPPYHSNYVRPGAVSVSEPYKQINQNGFSSLQNGPSYPLQQHYHHHHHSHTPPPTPNGAGLGGYPQRGNHAQLRGRLSQSHYPYPYPSDNADASSRFFRGYPPPPPLPSSPPPPPLPPADPPNSQLNPYFSPPPKKPPSLFPVPVTSSAAAASLSSYSQVPEPHPYFQTKPLPEFSTGFPPEESSKLYLGDAQPCSLKPLTADKPKFVDALQLFQHPHRATRPDHFVIILRGLPGSGKSYLAKMLRDLEVENGGDAPRIHSMDDYFMTEVEKAEDNDASKSSSSSRNKKPVKKKVMEYCYEPEMEEAYRASMLKAFKKTVEEGVFTFVIVDDRNLRVADFAQFWATAKRSGYEVYILEATYKDPAGCAARNVHGFMQEDIEKMARQWEEAPSLYLQLDVKSLFHGDDLIESRIQEVDMDMEDDIGDASPAVREQEAEKVVDPPVRGDASSLKDGKKWDAEGERPTEVRELGKSKWSEDFGEDEIDQTEGMKGNINALSGLIHQYGKERKSVHWGDQAGNTGFSIGVARKVNGLSLLIGPGAGYNLKSNPLSEEESPTLNSMEPKKHSIFQEQIRVERESFKAVFDRRRHRIGGLDVEDD